ncbi:hypothetical protein [Dyella sp.]|uniref:DUF7296 family protein n=1 Tax=Dyella sp. TaxID=1869338 RepID=UPI00284ECE91|nr:hypothetical protein [Dyella sp.]MDR3445952.1 hypothetical protein [Dyella sp.]
MKQTIEVDLKWFHFNQNNSGGRFIINDTVAEDVLIQARSAEEAINRATVLFEDYSDYCSCCGERWSYRVEDKEGTDDPTIHGVSVYEKTKQMFGENVRLHHYNGHVEALVLKDKAA